MNSRHLYKKGDCPGKHGTNGNPTLEATRCAATQETASIGCRTKVPYRIHKSSLHVYILTQNNPASTPFLSLQELSQYYPPTYVLVFLVAPFLLVLPPITYTRFFSPNSCYMPCQSHLLWLDHWRRVQIMKLLFRKFIHPSVTSPLYCP
jgi:hypothetical protein